MEDTKVMFFIDIKDAYGSVLLPKLFEFLKKWDFWKEEIGVLKFMYDNTHFRFNSAVGKATKGLPQGSKLSCELFILYLGECLAEVRK